MAIALITGCRNEVDPVISVHVYSPCTIPTNEGGVCNLSFGHYCIFEHRPPTYAYDNYWCHKCDGNSLVMYRETDTSRWPQKWTCDECMPDRRDSKSLLGVTTKKCQRCGDIPPSLKYVMTGTMTGRWMCDACRDNAYAIMVKDSLVKCDGCGKHSPFLQYAYTAKGERWLCPACIVACVPEEQFCGKPLTATPTRVIEEQ
jgi:hypothetical protein